MKKTSLIVLLITLLLTSCNPARSDREEDDADNPHINSVSELTDDKLNLFPAALVYKLKSYNSYKSVTKGSTHATGFLIDVTQSIDASVIKGEYSYYDNESHSSIVNTVHAGYYKGDKAVYADNGGAYQKSSIEDYLKIYGTYPLDNSIEGYLIKEGVTVSRLESEQNYKFKVIFDKDKTTTNVKIQMRQFGGLDRDPTFVEDTEMIFTVKEDLTPISMELKSHYKATKVLETDCHQTYTVTYSNFNETIEIPKLNEVISLFSE